jgi:hypothetical protein
MRTGMLCEAWPIRQSIDSLLIRDGRGTGFGRDMTIQLINVWRWPPGLGSLSNGAGLNCLHCREDGRDEDGSSTSSFYVPSELGSSPFTLPLRCRRSTPSTSITSNSFWSGMLAHHSSISSTSDSIKFTAPSPAPIRPHSLRPTAPQSHRFGSTQSGPSDPTQFRSPLRLHVDKARLNLVDRAVVTSIKLCPPSSVRSFGRAEPATGQIHVRNPSDISTKAMSSLEE